MRPGKQSLAIANCAKNNRGIALTTIDIGLLIICSQNLNLSLFDRSSINEDTTSVVVRDNFRSHLLLKCAFGHRQPHSSSSPFASILKPLEGTTSARPREEPQLSPPNDLHRLIPNLELAFLRPVVAARTKAQIRASSSDIVADAAVPLTIQSLAVAEIAAAGKDEQSTCCLPRFFENDGLGDGDDGIVWTEKTAERPDTMPD
jgi:hypothetical protein